MAMAFAAPAFAAEPDGTFVPNPGGNTASIENDVGRLSAQIIQNGQFVSGNCGTSCGGIDQTTTPASRADEVLGLLGKTRPNK